MSLDAEVLCEAYTILKQYIPAKDRQEAADNLMSAMVDMLSEDDLRELGSTDAPLGRALKEYSDEEDDDADSEYED